MNRSLQQDIRFCQTPDGVRLAYAVSGHGPPLIKVANWLSHLEHDFRSPVWRHVFAELSGRQRLVRYDERGCGLSDWQADLSFPAWLRDLETIVATVGVPRFALLGISQGAAIAAAYAAAHPERVSHLVIYGGCARGRRKRGYPPELIEEAETNARLAELGWGRNNAAFRQFFASQFLPDGTPEHHRWFNEMARLSTTPANAGRFMRLFHDIDVVDLLPKVQCPTLVMHARDDVRVPLEEGRLMASLIPDARFVILESSNHLVLEHEPAWAQWVRELRAFLPAGGSVADPAFAALTSREREVVELLARGCDNAQIAAHCSLSEKTVRNHISNIYAKLEVSSRAQAIVLSRNAGFGG